MKLTDDVDEALTAYELLDRRNHIQAEENEQDQRGFEDVVSKSSELGIGYVAGYIDFQVKWKI